MNNTEDVDYSSSSFDVNDTAAVNYSPLYAAFKDRGFIYEILPIIISLMIITCFGFYGNFSIAWTTYKFKQFHGTCGLMLCFGAVGDSLHQTSHLFLWYTYFRGNMFVELKPCVIINTIPVIGLNMGVFMMLFVAVDRLFSVMFPGRHRVINKPVYLGSLILIVIAFDVFCFLQIYNNMSLTPNGLTMCTIIDAMPGGIGQTWFTTCIVINIATIVCYVIVWIALKFKTSTSDSTKRIFKSLVILAGIVFFGWAVNAVIQVVLRANQVTPVEAWYIGMYAGIPVNVACSANYFVLYFFSNDYRIAFQRQLNTISNSVFGVSVVKPEGTVTVKPVTVTNTPGSNVI